MSALEARDRDPKAAMDIVNRMAMVFTEDREQWNQQQDKQNRIDVTMLDSVYNLGYIQYSPKTKINTLAAGLFGALIGVLVIFFLEWLVVVLGAIPPLSGDSATPSGEKRRQLIPGLRGTN